MTDLFPVYYTTQNAPQTDTTIFGMIGAMLASELDDVIQQGLVGLVHKSIVLSIVDGATGQIISETADVSFNGNDGTITTEDGGVYVVQQMTAAALGYTVERLMSTAVTALISEHPAGLLALGIAGAASYYYDRVLSDDVDNALASLGGFFDGDLRLESASGAAMAGAYLKNVNYTNPTQIIAYAREMLSYGGANGFPHLADGQSISYYEGNTLRQQFTVYDGSFVQDVANLFHKSVDSLFQPTTGKAYWSTTGTIGTPNLHQYNQWDNKYWVITGENDKLAIDFDGHGILYTYFKPSDIITGLHTTVGLDLSNNNLIIGTDADDTGLSGGIGDDYIFGLAGNDTLTGGAGNDHIDGGVGTDTAVYSENHTQYSIVGGQSGLIVTDKATSDVDTLSNVERIQFADGVYENGNFQASAPQAPTAESDLVLVQANGFIDINVLNNDSDSRGLALSVYTLTAAAHGDLVLYSNNIIRYTPESGYSGDDVFTYTIQNSDGLAATATVHVVVGSGNIILGTDGDDGSLNGTGSKDTIDGGNGSDVIHGGNGNDLIYGGEGNDILFGDGGNDTIYGGSGNDRFYGSDGIEQYVGGSGSDRYYFDMYTDTGWAGITEYDSQGSDLIYLDHVSSGNRIEFVYSNDQLNAYWYDSATGGFDFSFSIIASAALSGKGVESIEIDGDKIYSTVNIIEAAQNSANNTFVFDIATYQSGGYPALLGSNDINPVQPYADGGYSIYANWTGHGSLEKKIYGQEIFHALTYNGQGSPDPQALESPAIGYIKEFNLYSGFTIDNVRLTVDNTDNATLTIHLEDVGVDYQYENFEDGYTIHGYTMGYSGYSHIGNVIGSNSGSMTIYSDGVDPLQWAQEQSFETYYFESLNFANGDSINLRGMLHLEGTSEADTLYGLDRADIISGYDGNDTIYAKDGNDILDGGAGYDQMYGGLGDDVYRFAAGFGIATSYNSDFVQENLNEGTDTVAFVGGILPEDVRGWVDSGGVLHFRLSGSVDDEVRFYGQLGTGGTDINSRIEQVAFDDGTVWDLTQGLLLTDTDDGHINYGSAQNDVIDGQGGNDTIYAKDGNDILDGGAGYDQMYGGLGDDVYRFAAGFGIATSYNSDFVQENLNEGTDTVAFVGGILPEDVRGWVDSGGVLHFRLSGSVDDEVRFYGQLGTGGTDINSRIEQVAFDDGTVWDLTQGLLLTDTDDGHINYGSAQNDVIDGQGGNDTIYAKDGNDILDGGAGYDQMYGGLGDDVYRFAAGFGIATSYNSDFVQENLNEGTDTVAFVGGILPEDVRGWVDSGGVLHFRLSGSVDDEVRFYGQLGTGGTDINSRIEQVAFDDGTVWDLTQGLLLTDTDDGHINYGSAQNDVIDGQGGNDTIYAKDGNDILTGGTGADTLYGGQGNDTYVFAPGDGTDSIHENAGEGTDTIQFGAGITSGDIRLWTDSSGHLHLQNKQNTSDHLTVYASYTNVGGVYQSLIGDYVEQVLFHDGTVWNLTGGLAIEGSSAGESFYGTTYDDTISGYGGNDYLYGNSGNDILTGGTGADTLYGGQGNDTYVFAPGDGTDSIHENAGEGTDTIQFGAGITSGDIRLWTDSSGHLHLQNKQNTSDHLTVYASYTNVGGVYQSLIGDYVEQVLFHDGTVWNLTGGLAIEGSSAGESFYGTTYDDTISGYGGNDYLYGNSGNDILTGGTGADTLYGGQGNDTYVFAPGDGTDSIHENAGEGTDTIQFGAGITSGDIRLWTDSSGHLHLQNKQNTSDHLTVYASYTNVGGVYQSLIGDYVEQVLFHDGTVWNLTGGLAIEGSSAGESFYGTTYDDTISGYGGNDYLYGNSGNDILTGGTGADTLYGGQGNDTYVFAPGDGTDSIHENAGEGTDTIQFGAGITSGDIRLWTDSSGHLHLQNKQNTSDHLTVYASYTNVGGVYQSLIGDYVEQVLFHDGTVWNLTGGLAIEGSSAGESFYGTTYDDTISGYGGNDYLYGNSGNDILTGGTGADTLYGGAGNDVYKWGVGDGADYIQEESGSADKILILPGLTPENLVYSVVNTYDLKITSALNSADNITISGEFNTSNPGYIVEKIEFSDGFSMNLGDYANWIKGTSAAETLNGDPGGVTRNDTILGGAGNDAINGKNGSDTISGDGGADTIHGNGGNDFLHGGSGNDILYGDNGNDVLWGGLGADTMTGGAGADRFVFDSSTASSDTIKDFSPTEDILDLSHLISGFDPVTQAITDFVQITDSGANSIVKVDVDGTDNGVNFVKVATLQNVTGLTDEAALMSSGHLLAA